MNPDYSR